jgi:hypothetical protein
VSLNRLLRDDSEGSCAFRDDWYGWRGAGHTTQPSRASSSNGPLDRARVACVHRGASEFVGIVKNFTEMANIRRMHKKHRPNSLLSSPGI